MLLDDERCHHNDTSDTDAPSTYTISELAIEAACAIIITTVFIALILLVGER